MPARLLGEVGEQRLREATHLGGVVERGRGDGALVEVEAGEGELVGRHGSGGEWDLIGKILPLHTDARLGRPCFAQASAFTCPVQSVASRFAAEPQSVRLTGAGAKLHCK